jgi:hypothetical protein
MTGIFPLSDKDELVSKGRRNGTPRFHQGFQMRLPRQLKIQNSLTPFFAVGVAARKKIGLCNPNTIFVPSDFNLGNWNQHQNKLKKTRGNVKASSEHD